MSESHEDTAYRLMRELNEFNVHALRIELEARRERLRALKWTPAERSAGDFAADVIEAVQANIRSHKTQRAANPTPETDHA